MNVWLHTAIATVSLYAAYYAGTNWGRKNQTEDLIGTIFTTLLSSLEDDGFIRTQIDADGDKEIIPISEIERDAAKRASEVYE
jgi:hypothetical protein